MKTRILALLVVAALPLMAFDCISDEFTIAINLDPIVGTYTINQGSNPNYGGTATIKIDTLYDVDKYELTGAGLYDIRVSTSGPNLGNCSGSVTVNGILLFSYNGTWTQFNTPQSLLTSRLITRNQAGINTLINAVVNGSTITFVGAGSVTTTPVPAGCSVKVSAYIQAYGHLR
jgi:hypothetical protein